MFSTCGIFLSVKGQKSLVLLYNNALQSSPLPTLDFQKIDSTCNLAQIQLMLASNRINGHYRPSHGVQKGQMWY